MDERLLEEMQEREKRMHPIIERLVEEDPGLPAVSAIVMAGDFDGMQRWLAELEGVDVLAPFDEYPLENPNPRWLHLANVRVGSYARMDFIKRMVVEGRVPPKDVFPHLLDLWRGSDAPDTDPWWLGMFHEAWLRNDRQTLVDKEGPIIGSEWLTVYRGQPLEAKVGFSWSLKREVAEKFAITGGGRWSRTDGTVLTGKVSGSRVYAYMVQRGEEEIISDSVYITGTK